MIPIWNAQSGREAEKHEKEVSRNWLAVADLDVGGIANVGSIIHSQASRGYLRL